MTAKPTVARHVVVVGASNAGFCAAHAARERGASVLTVLDPANAVCWKGGSTA